jgi:16S rRNA A1518/A1519 N6-dimethyltransferase RsmA/KsgA/DIM1 with predicted DNA glycosylase/AP lyase activity
MWELAGILLLFAGFLLWPAYTWRTNKFGAFFVPSEIEAVENIIALAEIKKGDVFYELGSGDGRIVIAAALRGAKAYGVEIDLLRVWYSRFWIKLLRLSRNAQIIHQDFFQTKLAKADTVCLFLLPETNERLTKKLKKELKKGAKIISYAFPLKDWEPDYVDPYGGYFGPIYIYKK